MVSSEDGINWTTRAITRATGTGALKAINGNPNQNSTWAIIPSASTTAASSAVLGATAKARAYVADGKIFAIGTSRNNSHRGHVRIYKFINGAWTQLGIDLDGEGNYDKFAVSLCLNKPVPDVIGALGVK
jgi:hypothetical protein